MTHEGNLYVDGHLSAKTASLPAGTVTNAMVNGSAGIDATKLQHQYFATHRQVPGTAVVAATEDAFVVRGATGTLVALTAAITGTIATGADRTVTVDLQKSTAAGAFATVLSVTIVLDNSNVLRTPEDATFSSTSLVQDDILRWVVTVAGSAGNQALGLVACLHWREDAA